MVKELKKISVYGLNGKEVETLDIPVLKTDEELAKKFPRALMVFNILWCGYSERRT